MVVEAGHCKSTNANASFTVYLIKYNEIYVKETMLCALVYTYPQKT